MNTQDKDKGTTLNLTIPFWIGATLIALNWLGVITVPGWILVISWVLVGFGGIFLATGFLGLIFALIVLKSKGATWTRRKK